jgi:C1A family cysteine protease
MKFSSICAVLVLLGVVSVEGIQVKNKLEQGKVEKLFSGFVSKFQRNYRNNNEYNTRLSNFKRNQEIIEAHNAGSNSFQLEANKFADLSPEEFQSMMGLKNIDIDEATINAEAESFQSCQCEDTQPVTNGVDWRTKGVVANIKNQASCGGCYAFSSMETLQALYHLKKGPASSPTSVINLSEQQVIDCSSGYKNQGCSGGLMSYTFDYLKANSIMLEADYTYTAKKGTCKYSSTKGQFKVTSYVNLPKNDPAALLEAVNSRPVSVALRASSSVFQLYKSGIIDSTSCGTTIDHAVVVIGYGTEGGKDYWLLKNSWGTTWGEQGFFRIARTTSKDAGICGMLQLSSYPSGISI